MKKIFEQLYRGEHLSFEEMAAIAETIFNGQLSEGQLSAFLVALKYNGVNVAELSALAQVMQKNAVTITNAPLNSMDNCGTGGDHSNSFNISTTAAFVLAAGGIVMAKHGNRSISSRSGSADTLEVLGIRLDATPEELGALLNQVGIAFLFAPAMHPSMRAIMKIRQELATPTIFNLIGPLINPVPLETQLMGTYAGETLVETALTLGNLGRKQAIVIHGAGGMDEANLSGTTQCAMLRNGQVHEFKLVPEEYGFSPTPMSAITGGNPKKNAEILRNVLKNQPSPYLETVVLNAGLGFYANGKVTNLADGFTLARECIATGAAFNKLEALIQAQK